MNWLLPAATLAQLIASPPSPASRWAAGIDSRAARVSVISVAQLRVSIQGVADPAVRGRLDADLDATLAHLEADSGVPPFPFTADHSRAWGLLSLDSTISKVTQIDRMVYATAMFEGLTVVEPVRPDHAALAALGVRVHGL